MELCLTAVAVGLLCGLVYSLLGRGALEASTIALVSLVVVILGPITSPYLYPFGVGLLLGLSYDTLEDEWYGPTVSKNMRASYRARRTVTTTFRRWHSQVNVKKMRLRHDATAAHDQSVRQTSRQTVNSWRCTGASS